MTRRKLLGFVIAGSGLVGIAAPIAVLAQDTLVSFMRSVILDWIMWPFVQLLNLMVVILIEVASYNGFADAEIVTIGWETLRDLSNMFFVLILLIIAISTILKWQQINYRQNLRRLIMMALLINFSKTIAVFFIDLSQVITLTFISAVKGVLQAGIITALGLDTIVNPTMTASVGSATVSFAGNLVIFITAAIMILVALLVVTLITLIFAIRIIALWMILVFAPLAFLASTLPQTKEWYDRWWKIFGSNLTVAPALAFMLWLVFALVAKRGSDLGMPAGGLTGVEVAQIQGAGLMRYIIAIGLLMYSVRLAVSMGAAGGSVAAKIQGKFSGYAQAGGKWLARGSSGQGGALGLARKGAAAIATRPGESLYRPVDLASAGVQKLYRGAARMVGAGGHADRQLAARQARVAASDDRRKQKRETFEKREDRVSRTIRRFQRPFEVGEKERERERAATAGKKINTSQMTERQLKDELQSMGPAFGAKKVAAAREMMNRGTIDDLKKQGEEKDEEGNPTKNAVKQAALAKEATRLVFEESGLTPEEVDNVKQKNLRHTDVGSKDMQEFIKSMITEGKTFTRKDLTDGRTVETITKLASSTLSGPEFKKFMEKIPKEAKADAVRGLKSALSGLTITATMAPNEKEKRINQREAIRSQLGRFDPNELEKYAFPIVQRANPLTKQEEVVFDEKDTKKMEIRELNEYEDQLDKLAQSEKVNTIGTMDTDVLERLGNRFSPATIIKADTHEDVNGAQSVAILRGLARDIQLGAKSNTRGGKIVANFRTVLKNTLTGDALRQVVNLALLDFKQKNPGIANPYANARKLIDEFDRETSKKDGKKGPDAGSGTIDVGESEAETESEGSSES